MTDARLMRAVRWWHCADCDTLWDDPREQSPCWLCGEPGELHGKVGCVWQNRAEWSAA